MSHESDSSQINSGPLNHVQFPGSEEGLSLVDFVGEVEADCLISFVTLRLTTSAASSATATTQTPAARLSLGLGATTSCAANASVDSIVRRRLGLEPQAASATSLPLVFYVRTSAAASTAASVSVFANALIYARRGASVSSVADASVGSRTRVSRLATIIATALGSAAAFRALQLSATTLALASSFVATRARFRLSAAGSASAGVFAFALRKMFFGASSGSAASLPTASLTLRRSVSAQSLALADAPPVAIGLAYLLGASVEPSVVAQAAATLRMAAGATTSAQASTFVEATDLSLTRPAPVERRMTVPAQNRRMEVTE